MRQHTQYKRKKSFLAALRSDPRRIDLNQSGRPTPELFPSMSQSTDVDPDAESLRLAQQLEDEEFAAYREPALGFSEAELAEMDDETRQSIELAMRLQEEERLRIQEQQAAAERLEGQADDEESIALAIRLQQEDDESALRNALGVTDGEPGSPSEYTYEQLMRLQDTVGMVSRGASQDDISALRTLTVEEARRPGSNIVLGEQVSANRRTPLPSVHARCAPRAAVLTPS